MNANSASTELSPVSGKRILFVNSGSRKKRVTFEEAKKLGLSITLVHASDTYANEYCENRIISKDKTPEQVMTEIEALHKERPFDGVITFLEEEVEFVAMVAERLGLIGNTPETADIARNKFRMRQCLEAAGVPVPRARLVETFDEAKAAAAVIKFPLVIKPYKGTDSLWVMKVTSDAELEQAYADLTKYSKHPYEGVLEVDTKKYVMEEYMPGPEVSTEILVQNEKIVFMAIIDKLPMIEPYFIERGDVCPSRHPEPVQEKIKAVAEATVQAIGMKNGIAHVEIKVTPEGPKTVEIAARMGGDYICDWIQTVYDVRLARQGLLIALGYPVDLQPQVPKTYLRGEYFIPTEDCLLKEVASKEEVDKIADDPDVHDINIWAHKGDTLLTPPRGFDTVGWVVMCGVNPSDVDENVKAVCKQVGVVYEPIEGKVKE